MLLRYSPISYMYFSYFDTFDILNNYKKSFTNSKSYQDNTQYMFYRISLYLPPLV